MMKNNKYHGLIVFAVQLALVTFSLLFMSESYILTKVKFATKLSFSFEITALSIANNGPIGFENGNS
jgi:hypothetical protein